MKASTIVQFMIDCFLFSKDDCATIPIALAERLASNPNHLSNWMQFRKQHFDGTVLVN